jgi:hypothetical protein
MQPFGYESNSRRPPAALQNAPLGQRRPRTRCQNRQAVVVVSAGTVVVPGMVVIVIVAVAAAMVIAMPRVTILMIFSPPNFRRKPSAIQATAGLLAKAFQSVQPPFNQFGDLERCSLRPGNVHSADGWDGVLRPVVARYRGKVSRIYFRADAGFANPDVYEFLEAEGTKYAIRLPANRVLQDRIGYLLKRPVGRPSNEVRRYYAKFRYQAGSWNEPRRDRHAMSR